MSNPTGTPDWIKSQLPENKPASPPERGRAVSVRLLAVKAALLFVLPRNRNLHRP
jgi:hypothetical protein